MLEELRAAAILELDLDMHFERTTTRIIKACAAWGWRSPKGGVSRNTQLTEKWRKHRSGKRPVSTILRNDAQNKKQILTLARVVAFGHELVVRADVQDVHQHLSHCENSSRVGLRWMSGQTVQTQNSTSGKRVAQMTIYWKWPEDCVAPEWLQAAASMRGGTHFFSFHKLKIR